MCHYADLAHLVERHLAKVEVAGSSPVIRSKKSKSSDLDFFIQADRLGISSPHEVWWIPSALRAVYHHALACIQLRLDDIPLFEWMICKTSF